ncbi:MAG TPA: hypothetical protein VN698_04630 [Bacteroidia bacterium]|nr:hypothetical protein [Bacteroidia bacterium]
MKSTTMKTLATCVVAASILFTGCKKGDVGPAGANGTNGIVPASTDGFIKGTLIGTRQNGAQINETFNFTNFWGGHAGTLDSNSASYTYNVQRAADIFGANSAAISVSVATTTATTGVISLNSFSFTKTLGTNKEFDFTTNGNNNTTITGLSYDKNSGQFTGSFTMPLNAAQNSTGNTATISGSFQATITQLYNFTHHAAAPNVSLKD